MTNIIPQHSRIPGDLLGFAVISPKSRFPSHRKAPSAIKGGQIDISGKVEENPSRAKIERSPKKMTSSKRRDIHIGKKKGVKHRAADGGDDAALFPSRESRISCSFWRNPRRSGGCIRPGDAFPREEEVAGKEGRPVALPAHGQRGLRSPCTARTKRRKSARNSILQLLFPARPAKVGGAAAAAPPASSRPPTKGGPADRLVSASLVADCR